MMRSLSFILTGGMLDSLPKCAVTTASGWSNFR